MFAVARKILDGLAYIAAGVFHFVAGTVLFCMYGLWAVGAIYWLWSAVQVGSFLMFLVGVIPPAIVATGLVGAYALLFGMPDWVFRLFG